MIDIQFLRPQVLPLYIAVGVPVLLVLAAISWMRILQLRRSYSEERLLKLHSQPASKRSVILQTLFRLIVTGLVAAAASGPTASQMPDLAQTGSVDAIVVMDVSISTLAEPYRSTLCQDNRQAGVLLGPCGTALDMAIHIVKEQIEPALNGNRLGLVLYAARAFPQAELTDDYAALNFLFDHWVGRRHFAQSNYAAGLAEAVAMFERDGSSGKDKVIILFSDGGFDGGNEELLNEVLVQMQEQGIRLVVIGVGPMRPMPIPQYEDGVQQPQSLQMGGETVTVMLNSSNIRALADRAGGEYIEISSGSSLNLNLAGAMTASLLQNDRADVYQIPLAMALVLLAGQFATSRLRLRWHRGGNRS